MKRIQIKMGTKGKKDIDKNGNEREKDIDKKWK